MAVPEDAEAVLAAKFAVMRELLDERQWRVYLGTEAGALGHGGIAAVARASGASETMVAAGAAEAGDGDALEALARGRSRRPGAGRPKAEDAQPGLRQALGKLVEEATRGDPVSEITWCSLSLRDLERRMAGRGFRCGKDAIARMLREGGYSLQGDGEGPGGQAAPGPGRPVPAHQCHDRGVPDGRVPGGQRGYEEERAARARITGTGRAWRPGGDPVKVRDHDFPMRSGGRSRRTGSATSPRTPGSCRSGPVMTPAAFAVNALRLWWQREGSLRYPGVRRLLVTCDAGGSNGYRCRLWKDQLAVLAGETGLKIRSCTSRPARASGTRSSTGCSATSPAPGRPGRS